MRVTFKVLNRKGDEPTVCETTEDLEREFKRLMDRGYALFLDETQIRSTSELGDITTIETEVIAVPSIAGGK